MDHPWQQLLLYMYREGVAWFKNLSPDDWRRNRVPAHGSVADLNLLVMRDQNRVQYCLKEVSNAADPGARRGFIIPPCKHDEKSLTVLVPFIMEGGANPRLSLQLGVLSGGTFFGYRFESPELYEEHNYHHVQPVQTFGHGPPLDISATWYPNRYPSFPLMADGGAELVAALLVSIREWNRMKELSTSNKLPHEARQVVARFLQKVRPLM